MARRAKWKARANAVGITTAMLAGAGSLVMQFLNDCECERMERIIEKQAGILRDMSVVVIDTRLKFSEHMENEHDRD